MTGCAGAARERGACRCRAAARRAHSGNEPQEDVVDEVAIAASIVVGLCTGVGGLGLLFVGTPSQRLLDVLLGFTAGIMLAASVFSLLLPALEAGSISGVSIGFGVGLVAMALLDRLIPHVHAQMIGTARGDDGAVLARAGRRADHRGMLLLSAMTIHNIPEGLAVGSAFAAGGVEAGMPVATAIGLQNIPEGFAAGAPLLAVRGRWAAAGLAAATGIVEPIAAVIAMVALGLVSSALPAALAFAAGAMVYVVVDELIPESHSHGNQRLATLGLGAGFVVMMLLDTSL